MQMICFFVKKHFLIILVIFVAVFVRFYGLQDRGIELWDGCLYANIAKTPIYAIKYIIEKKWPHDVEDFIAWLDDNGCKFSAVRLGHTFLIFLSLLLFGVNECAVLIPSALCGVVSVFMVYLIGMSFFSKEAGLIAAFVMALSGFQIAFSRTSYPQTESILLFTLFSYFYFKYKCTEEKRYLYIAGMMFGLSPFFHPSFYIVALPIVIDFIFNYLRSWKCKKKETLVLVLIVALPLAAEEMFFGILNHLFPGRGAISVIFFFGFQTMAVADGGNDIRQGFKFFYDMIVQTDGIVWVLIYIFSLSMATIHLLRKWDWALALLIIQLVITITFWAWQYPTVKAINVSYPAMSLIVGYVAWQLALLHGRVNLIIAGVALSIVATAHYNFINNQLRFQAPYKQMMIGIKGVVEKKGGLFTARDQKNLTELLDFYMPLIDKSTGTVFRRSNIPKYKLIDWRVIKDHKEYVRKIEKSGNLVLREKLYATTLLPITHYHRLENKGFNYIRENFDTNWLCAKLYAIP
jgi:4-amino-4-deoxy-L-arabinose transferase-like glycosyltransferase